MQNAMMLLLPVAAVTISTITALSIPPALSIYQSPTSSGNITLLSAQAINSSVTLGVWPAGPLTQWLSHETTTYIEVADHWATNSGDEYTKLALNALSEIRRTDFPFGVSNPPRVRHVSQGPVTFAYNPLVGQGKMGEGWLSLTGVVKLWRSYGTASLEGVLFYEGLETAKFSVYLDGG